MRMWRRRRRFRNNTKSKNKNKKSIRSGIKKKS
jgi:hypothetical protein